MGGGGGGGEGNRQMMYARGAHTLTHTITLSLSLSLTHTHTHARTHARAHTHTHARTHTHALTHTRTDTHRHTRSHVTRQTRVKPIVSCPFSLAVNEEHSHKLLQINEVMGQNPLPQPSGNKTLFIRYSGNTGTIISDGTNLNVVVCVFLPSFFPFLLPLSFVLLESGFVRQYYTGQ